MELRRTGSWLWLIVVAAALVAAVRVHDLLLVACIAILMAVYLGSFTDLFCRWLRLPRPLGLVLSLLLTLGGLTGIGFLLAPAVASQTGDLIAAVPGYLQSLDAWVRHIASSSAVLRRTGIGSPESGLVTTALGDAAEYMSRSFFAYAAGTGKVIIDVAAIVAMALYLAAQPQAYVGSLLQTVPPAHRPLAQGIANDLAATLRAWVGAQLLAMVVLSVATGIGLWLLDVPYWLAFATYAGIAALVPFFGSITSTILPALLVLPDRGLGAAVVVALVGVGVHVIEANVVHPLIMQHRVSLPPALTILAVLMMGELAGILGMVVAVPITATVVVVVRHVLIHQMYGEPLVGALPRHAVLRPSRPTPAPEASSL
jgi:predicted PurR-regulated permease PerM